MKNIFEVGVGFFKTNFFDALNKAGDGDTIILSEGFYYLPDTFELTNSISIIAKESDYGKVIISNPFNVFNGSKITIKNIKFIGDFLTNQFNLCNGSSLYFENCYFERGEIQQNYGDLSSATYYPLIYTNKSNVELNRCEIYESTFELSILAEEESSIKIYNSIVAGVQIVSRTYLESFNNDFLTFIRVYDNSKIDAKGSLAIYGNHNWRVLHVLNGSSVIVDTLYSHDWTFLEIGVGNSYFEVSGVDFDENCNVKVVFDEKSEIKVVEPIILEKENVEEEQLNIQPIDQIDETVSTSKTDSMSQLQEMIGLQAVKKKVEEFISMVNFNQKRAQMGLPTQNIVLHSLFLGNPGTGKTTVARLLGELLYDAGVISESKLIEVDRSNLVAEVIGGTAPKTLAKLEQARGGILFVDEAYTLYSSSGNDFGKEALNTIMKFMEDNRDDIMVIFAGYHDEMQNFLTMNPGLASRVTNVFDFEDYTAEEIFDIGKQNLLKLGYQFDEDYYKKVITSTYKKEIVKSNARFVRNFNEKICKSLASRLMSENSFDITTIKNEDITNAVGGTIEDGEKRIKELLDELNSLIGLKPVKEFVSNLVKQTAIDKRMEEQLGMSIANSTYHMIFTGNPGTGKTTVARIVGEIFYYLGILNNKHVKEVSRPDLVAGFKGQTAIKTKEVITSAMGGVLFVDEAYQLKQTENDDFGAEAIETLITELENHRSDFIAIFAGYTKEMERFLDVNEGMRSRIPISIEFPDYTPEEVGEIVKISLVKHWNIGDYPIVERVAEVYRQIPDKDKSNARWARNLVDEIVNNHRIWLYDNSSDDILTISQNVLSSTILGRVY